MADNEEQLNTGIALVDMVRQVIAGALFNLAVKAHPLMMRQVMHTVVHRDHQAAAEGAKEVREEARRVRRSQLGLDPN
jgi:hypothetical protein